MLAPANAPSPFQSEHKLQAQKLWNATPCGTGDYLSEIGYASLEYFDEIRRSRYEITDPWMPRIIDFSIAKDKKLLEIGHGIGTDLLSFCEQGAKVHGIDITQEHHRLAKANFELHGRSCVLKLCDAADIDFPSESFDVVYSLGVLMSTPDTVRCVSEAYRVLKPGGLFIMGVYHTYSAFHIVNKLLYEGVLKGKLRKLGYRGLMSTIERGADGVEVKPLVKTYRKTELKHILGDFSEVRFRIGHLHRSHFTPRFGKYLPRVCERLLEPWLGWYIVAFARK